MEFFLIRTKGHRVDGKPVHKLRHLISTNPFVEELIDLPAGSYLFREVPTPMGGNGEPWLALVDPSILIPGADKRMIVGIIKSHFIHLSSHHSPFEDLNWLDVDLEVINLEVCAPIRRRLPRHLSVPRQSKRVVARSVPLRRRYHPAACRTFAVG